MAACSRREDKSVSYTTARCGATQTSFENAGRSTQEWLSVNSSLPAECTDQFKEKPDEAVLQYTRG